MKYNGAIGNLASATRATGVQKLPHQLHGFRRAHTQAFQRRSTFWIPPVAIDKHHGSAVDATTLLIRAGYLRQAYSGIFNMLPLGLRVQNKIEKLIDKHMTAIGASKVSLSSLSSQALWEQSGRLGKGTEFFKLTDRRDFKWLLTPTHEEEITRLVGEMALTRKSLPIRLYQVTRKYRDEKRPRGGMLRGREFLMKDLYTFDANEQGSRSTYDAVRGAYAGIFDALKVEYISARADSGDMGGSLSHEYHLLHASGEDDIVHCPSCGFAKNEEVVEGHNYEYRKVEGLPGNGDNDADISAHLDLSQYIAVSKDGLTLVKACAPKWSNRPAGQAVEAEINSHAVKAAFQGYVDLDTGVENPTEVFVERLGHLNSLQQPKTCFLFDDRVPIPQRRHIIRQDWQLMNANDIEVLEVNSGNSSTDAAHAINLLKASPGDQCPTCQRDGLQVHRAIEVGHTFHLGTRYSAELDAVVNHDGVKTPLEMGCHGIGVSRLIAAIAACCADSQGLNWPKIVAPFQVVVLGRPDHSESAANFSARLANMDANGDLIDVLLDDRPSQSLPYKLKDADAIGYPIIVVFGASWEAAHRVEIQCRRLHIKEEVAYEEASGFIQNLLCQL